MGSKLHIGFLFIGLSLLFSGCLSKKYLQDDEYFLHSYKIKFKNSTISRDLQTELGDDLQSLTKPKPNDQFLGWRYGVWLNSWVDEPKDTSNFDNWIRRKLAESPVLVSDPYALDTKGAMSNYLRNRGFFQSDLRYTIDTSQWRRQAKVLFEVDLEQRYIIDTFQLVTKDTVLAKILPRIEKESILKKGAPLDNKVYNQEVSRITNYLRNSGFAYFYQNNVGTLLADSIAGKPNHLKVTMELFRPDDKTHHKQYKIDKVTFKEIDKEMTNDTLINGVNFQFGEDGHTVKPKYLNNFISIRPEKPYSQAKLNETLYKLNNIGVYKFVSIKVDESQKTDSTISFNILVSESKKKLLSLSLDGNFTRESVGSITGNRNFVGTSTGIRYRIRNIRKTATQVDLNANAGVEFNFSSMDEGRRINIFETSLGSDIVIPRFIEVGTFSAMRSLGFFPKFYDKLKKQSETHIVGSINYQDRLRLFEILSVQLSFAYDFTPRPGERWRLSQAGFNYAFNRLDPRFKEQLDPNLLASFEPYIISGLLFKDFTFTKQDPNPFRRLQRKFRFNFELSGLEMLLVNAISNGLREPIRINNIPFSYYVKAGVTQIYEYRVSNNSSLLWRGDVEMITQFSGAGSFPPYFKLPFVGGPFSLRGWLTRGLGPGASIVDLNSLVGVQVGELKLETNLEYRFKLLWLLHGAVFLDAGNIYNFRGDDIGRINERFYDALAVNTGFGFRVKLPYFTFRWDIGLPIRYPFELESGSKWVPLNNIFDNANYGNIALGFPF